MDEAHGVRDQDVLSVGQREPARGRVQGGEELVLRVDVRGGQRVEQRALPGVGVSDERDNRHRRFLPPVAVEHPVGLHLVQLLLQELDAVAQEALVDLDLLLAHALDLPSRAAAARRAVQVRPHPRQSRELILQLRHLNLQLPLRGPRALTEYVQDEHRAVAHPNLTVQVLLDVRFCLGVSSVSKMTVSTVGSSLASPLEEAARADDDPPRRPRSSSSVHSSPHHSSVESTSSESATWPIESSSNSTPSPAASVDASVNASGNASSSSSFAVLSGSPHSRLSSRIFPLPTYVPECGCFMRCVSVATTSSPALCAKSASSASESSMPYWFSRSSPR